MNLNKLNNDFQNTLAHNWLSLKAKTGSIKVKTKCAAASQVENHCYRYLIRFPTSLISLFATWGQFHQRSTRSFYVCKLRTQLFCTYILGLFFTGVQTLVKLNPVFFVNLTSIPHPTCVKRPPSRPQNIGRC